MFWMGREGRAAASWLMVVFLFVCLFGNGYWAFESFI